MPYRHPNHHGMEPAPAARHGAPHASARSAVRAIPAAPAGLSVAARIVLATSIALLALALPRVASAQQAPEAFAPQAPRDEVVVSGEGVVHGEPDLATLALGVEASNEDARAVIEETSQAMTLLQEALALHGIEEVDVRTTTFDLYTERPRDAEGQPLPERYRLVHMVEVTVRDVATVGDVLAAAVEAGANRIGGITFGIADPAELEAQARRAAVDNARAKAEQLAEAAGRSLGEAVHISESLAIPVSRSGFEARAMALDASVPVASGQLAVRVNVSVVFELQ